MKELYEMPEMAAANLETGSDYLQITSGGIGEEPSTGTIPGLIVIEG